MTAAWFVPLPSPLAGGGQQGDQEGGSLIRSAWIPGDMRASRHSLLVDYIRIISAGARPWRNRPAMMRIGRST